jgi:DNA-binding response OmpR family regulator
MVEASSKAAPISSNRDAGKRPLVFIVDDDRDTVSTLSFILESEGYSVFGMYNGTLALRELRRRKPAALILDIDLPGPSGYAIARDIRDEYGERSPLLIAITGVWVKSTDRLLSQMVGFDHFCVKPCEPSELLELLEPLRNGPALSGDETLG